ncbi:MAG: NepR family anti-sigma factor [Jannaschia sp.]
MSKDVSHDGTRSTVDTEIDRNLRRAFEDIASEPLPDRFSDLLKQLRTSSTGGSGDTGGDDR